MRVLEFGMFSGFKVDDNDATMAPDMPQFVVQSKEFRGIKE